MKNVYLVTSTGTFVAFGVGMVIFSGNGCVKVANTNGESTWESVLSECTTEAAANIIVKRWARAIARSPEGAVLEWDDTRLEVVAL